MIFSINDIVLVLNGHLVEGGYSEDADALMFDAIELISEAKVGAGGDVAYVATGTRGGGFTMKFLPNAPSIPYFIQQANIVRGGGSIIWDGSMHDARRGVSAQLVYGAMRSFMPFPSYGKGAVSNMEFPFMFREVIPNYEAAHADAFVLQTP